MPRPLIAFALACLVGLALPAVAGAAGAVPYRGATEQGRGIKLIADRDGRVKRGRFEAVTACGSGYERFTGEFAFRGPLDRSQAGRFRDRGSRVESDATHSARYRWDIAGRRKGRRKIVGAFDVAIVFRRNGHKYVTCTAEDVAYTVKRSHRRD